MNQDLLRRIVSIEAHFGGATERGTGFRLAPGRVLTAQHVVERRRHDGGLEKASRIIVRLDVDVPVDVEGEAREAEARWLWSGSPDLDPADRDTLDVALLEDDLPPEGLEPFRHFVPVMLGDRGEWETQGFPVASSETAAGGSEYLSGTCHPSAERASHIALTLDREPPRDPEAGKILGWGGASGAPIFVRGGRYDGALYGVLRAEPAEFRDKIWAVALPLLLRQPEFRRHLGLDEAMPPHPSLVDALRRLLEEDDELTTRLARLDCEWSSCWREKDIAGLVGLLATEVPLRIVLERLDRLRAVFDPTSPRGRRFRELALVLVALGARHEIPGAAALDTAALERIQGRTELSTASACFAEVFLAGAFGRAPRFEATPDDLPRAYLRVPTTVLESGIRGSACEADQLEEMMTDFVLKELGSSRLLRPSEIDRMRHFPPAKRIELYRKQLERNFAQLRRRHGGPPYLLADSALRNHLKDDLGRFLGRLEKSLPTLHLVELRTDLEAVEQAIEHDDALYPLWEILDLLNED